MTISEETLMAFADGELDDAARQAVEAAMREDAELQKRVARHRALRKRLQAAFADQLSEPVPPRLQSVVRAAAAAAAAADRTSNVVDLREARAAGARAAQARESSRPAGSLKAVPRASWLPLGSVAAGVLLGLGIGYGLWKQGGAAFERGSGGLVANAQLAAALSSQLSTEQSAASAVHIGVSYVAMSGEYCRTFTLRDAPAARGVPAVGVLSGVACREREHWQIHALAQGAAQSGADYRTAASGVSPVILKLVEDEIRGEPLDAAGESNARGRGWAASN